MAVTFPPVKVGSPVRYDRLSVFPLFPTFPTERGEVDYVLSHVAIDGGSVAVEEVNEAGSVPELSVENRGDVRVLFLEGEELIGAKQNRVLNTSVLIAAHSKTRIPVSCTEQGRWGYKSRKFQSAGTHAPSRLRYFMKASVSRSLKENRGYRSDQGQVWREVSRQQAALRTSSETGAMADTFAAYRDRLNEFREKLQYVDGACGAAVAVGSRIVACDLFDKPSTCKQVWDRLLSGFSLDAVESEESVSQAESGAQQTAAADDVERLLGELSGLPWQADEPVGEGEESRAESPSGAHASVLSLGGTLVHASVVTAD